MNKLVLSGDVPSEVAVPTDWEAGPTNDKYAIHDGFAFECRVGGIVYLGHTLAEAIGLAIGAFRDLAWPEILRRAEEAKP